MKVDWRSLPAGIELDRAFYSAVAGLPPNASFEDDDETGYVVRWDNKISFVDRVSRDAEAAIGHLPPSPNVVMIMRGDTDEWHCWINSISSRLSDKGEGTGETVALAVCRAVLDWHEHQDEAKR